jgi:glucosylglycerate synthase
MGASMAESNRGILMYETTLGPQARSSIRQIGQADVLIGIPSYRNGRTILEVIENVVQGIKAYLPDRRVVLMNTDGGSSDNTVRCFEDVEVPSNVSKLLILYQGQAGKGTAVCAIFEAAMELQAKVCAVIEARAPGIQPEWVPALVDPILRGADMALPCYERSAFASALSDNLAYPFLCGFFGTCDGPSNMNAVLLREPVPHEFSLSGAIAADLAGRDVWETDVARFGINVWIALQALFNPFQVAQIHLGYRGDGSYEPGAPLDTRFLHTVSTLFRVLTTHRRMWQDGGVGSSRASTVAIDRRMKDDVQGVGDHPSGYRDWNQDPSSLMSGSSNRILNSTSYIEPLLNSLYEGRERYWALWQQILSAELLVAIEERMAHRETFYLPIELWAAIMIEFAIVFNRGEGDPDKVIEALQPLFYGRAASYVRESHPGVGRRSDRDTDSPALDATPMTAAQREQIVQHLVRRIMQSRAMFLEKWNDYEPWVTDQQGYW